MAREWLTRSAVVAVLVCGWERFLLAQGTSPWVDAVANLSAAFTGPIARGVALIAIVIAGCMFAMDEGGGKQRLAGVVFGLGMALGAANFIAWLFN